MRPFVAAAAQDVATDAPKLIKFVPFDPATKMSEATVADASGATQRVVKGAFAVGHRPRPAVADRDRRGKRARGARVSGCWRSRPDRRRR